MLDADIAPHSQGEPIHDPEDTTTPPAPDAIWIGSGDA